MNADRKRELRNTYKSKPVIGGVCCIRCSGDGRVLMQATTNVEGLKNRFEFAMATGTCPDPSLRGAWETYGAGAFSFAVLEEIKRGETQTQREFSDDVNALYEMWLEKSQTGDWTGRE